MNFSDEIRLIRPLDVFLFILLVTAAAWSAFNLAAGEGRWADIYVRNRKTARLSLSGEAQFLRIPTEIGDIVIRYGGGGVRVESSPCRMKICMRHGNVSLPRQRIICVPGRMVIIIKGNFKIYNEYQLFKIYFKKEI